MTRPVRAALRTLAIALGALVLFGVATGARPMYAYRELRCAQGYTAQPVSIAPVFVCRPAIADPTITQWPQAVATQNEIALYLVNLRMRVFHFDFVWGTTEWFAFDVPSPPYG